MHAGSKFVLLGRPLCRPNRTVRGGAHPWARAILRRARLMAHETEINQDVDGRWRCPEQKGERIKSNLIGQLVAAKLLGRG